MFVRAANPIWFFLDFTGLSLNDNYYAFFRQNIVPYNPQPVYQGPGSTFPTWPYGIQFSPGGALPNNLYFDPGLVYRIEVREGPTDSSPLIYLIENFIPGQGGSVTIYNDFANSENIIVNPQFATVNFDSPLTYKQTSSSVYTVNVAPGWQLVLTGAGQTILTQGFLSGAASSSQSPIIAGNPPTYLNIVNSGWTTATLVQYVNGNGAIFANGSIAMSFVARSNGSADTVSAFYTPSVGSDIPLINAAVVPLGVFTTVPVTGGAANTGASTNTNTGSNAYVTFTISIPGTCDFDITNIQVVGQTLPLSSGFISQPPFIQQTPAQQVNAEFNYYLPQLSYKQIPSALVGWDFPLNPAQTGSTLAAGRGANASFYTWDQTIVYQSAASGVGVTAGAQYEFVLTAAAATQTAIIQYIPAFLANKLLNDQLSVNLSAYATTGGGLPVTISLWYTNSTLPSTIGSALSIVATLDANGKPATFNGTWTEIPRQNTSVTYFDNALFKVNAATNGEFNDYNFNNWNVGGNPTAANSATFIAIVIGTGAMGIGDTLHINSVGLMNGSIATRPAVQTPDEVIRQCQFYYEQSFPIGTIPSAATGNGAIQVPVQINKGSPSDGLPRKSFTLIYNQIKYALLTPKFYSPVTKAVGNVSLVLNTAGTGAATQDAAVSTWTAVGSSQASYSLQATTAGTVTGAATSNNNEGYIWYHYIADSRLGQ